MSYKNIAGTILSICQDLSSSDDDDDELIIMARKRKTHNKIKYYVENTVFKYSVEDFRTHFRMNRGDVENGTTVFEENVADFSGVNLAYTAYKKWTRRNTLGYKLPGVRYTADQLFWIMTSTYVCYEPKLLENDDSRRKKPMHAIPSYRVIGRLRNSPYFAEAFNCPIGSPMNPRKKCRIFA